MASIERAGSLEKHQKKHIIELDNREENDQEFKDLGVNST
jgi:hypothetical protein